jgi:integrase
VTTASQLKRRHQTWFVRVAVPRPLRATLGKSEVLRSLKTHDLHEANRLKYRVIAEIKDELARATAAAGAPKGSPQYLLEVARGQRETVTDGTQDESAAQAGLDAAVDAHLDHAREEYGYDPQTGDPNLPQEHTEGIKLAFKVFDGADVTLLSTLIRRHLAELQPRVTRAWHAAKTRELNAFATWLKRDVEVTTITRKLAGAYVAEKITPSGRAAVTRKNAISTLTSFGEWLENYGVLDVNPFARLTRTVKEPRRGGVAGVTKRPYSAEEIGRLIQGLPPGDQLLSLACIGAYSGMRIDEIAALTLADVSGDAFRISKAKNTNSIRFVPIHQSLAGMVERLKETATDGFLIPGLLSGGTDDKRSHVISNRFGRFLRTKGFGDDLDFHSLRRSFSQRCEDAGIAESTAKLLTGHARQSMTYGLYSPGPEWPTLIAAMQKVTYGATTDALVVSLADSAVVTRKASAKKPKRSIAVPR